MRFSAILLAAVVVVATLATVFAMPGGSMSVSTPFGSTHVKVSVTSPDANMPMSRHGFRIRVEMNGLDVNVPVRMRHMHIQRMEYHNGNLVMRLDSNHECNCLGPDRALFRAERAIRQHLRVQNMDQNRLVEAIAQRMQLSECREYNADTGDFQYKPCYVAPVKVRARLLGIIPITTDENVVIDAETGQVQFRGPWWAFLLLGPRELAG